MCLSKVYPDKQKKKWLKSKSDIMTVYKAVLKREDEYYPTWKRQDEVFQTNKVNRIKKGNRHPVPSTSPYPGDSILSYIPYFHIFRYKKDAKSWWTPDGDIIVVRCEIKKRDITAVGLQDGRVVIVTRAFKIIKEVE